MRLRLEIRRHDLPVTKIAWNTSGLHAYTAAAKNAAAGTLVSQLLQDVNALIPLESEEWGLEDYIVEHDGYECLHFSYLEQILADGDLLIIRPLETPEVRSRRVSGRDQISVDGRHLHDGVAFGQPLTRFIQRPSIRIPPRKKARLALEPKSDELEPGPEPEVDTKKAGRSRKEYKGLVDETSTGRGLAITGAGINTPRVKTPKGVSFSKSNVPSDVAETPATVVWADEMDEDDEDDEDFAGDETSEESTSSEEDEESDSEVSSSESNKENVAPSTELPLLRTRTRKRADDNQSDSSDTEVNSARMDEVSEDTTSEEDRDSEDDSLSVESETSSSSESSESSESSDSSVSSAAESVVSPPKEVPTARRKRKAETDLAQEVLRDKVTKEKPIPKEKAVLAGTQEKPKATPAPTQTFVPPGEGLTKTQRRNQRRKIKVKVDRLKEQGLLNDDSTPDEVEAQLAIYDAHQSRSGGSVSEPQAIPEPAPTVKEPVNGIPDAAKEAMNGTHEDTPTTISAATEEPQLSKRQLKRQRQKELKAQEKAEFEKRKDDLMTSIANGGLDVTPAAPISKLKEKEPQVETSIVEVPDSQIPPAESTPAATTSRRLDIGSAKRLLFGALGLRTPKNKEEADKLRTKLDTLNPRRSVPVVINTSEAPESETAQENTTTESPHLATGGPEHENENETTNTDKAAALAGGYEYDPNWQDKIVVSAVECVWENVEFPPPPFPFVQRWHGIKFSDTKKKKRKLRDAEQYYQNTEHPVEAEYAEDAVELDYDGTTTREDGLRGAGIENDLPQIPDNIETLPLLEKASTKPGTVICYKVLEVTAQTKWQPQVSKLLTAEILAVDGTKLEMRLAKRDQPQREIDPLTGEKIYSNFELRPVDEDDEERIEEGVGLVELNFAELIQPRIISAPASSDENFAGLVAISTEEQTTQRSGPQDSMEYQFAQIVAPLGQSESAPSLQIQQDEDTASAHDHESNLPPSVQVQTTSIEEEDGDVDMRESPGDFIAPEDDHREREVDMIEEDIVPETLFQVDDSPTPMPITPPPPEDVSTESHGYMSAVSALADAIHSDDEADTPLPAPITQSTSASLPPALHFNSTGTFDGSFDFEENGLPDLNDFISASQAHWSRRTQKDIEPGDEEEEPLPQTVSASTRSGPPPGSQIIDITLSSDVDVPTSKSQPAPSTRRSSATRKKKRKAW